MCQKPENIITVYKMGRSKETIAKPARKSVQESSEDDEIDESIDDESQHDDSEGIGSDEDDGSMGSSEGEDVNNDGDDINGDDDASDTEKVKKSSKSRTEDGLIPKDFKKKSKMVAEAKKFAESMAKRGVVRYPQCSNIYTYLTIWPGL
jgi:hypothetical protein